MGTLFTVSGTTGNINTAGSITASGAITSTTGDITLQNQHSVIFQDIEITPKSVTLHAPTTLTNSYTLNWPLDQGAANTFIVNDGSGNLSFPANLTWSGTLLSVGTEISIVNASGNATLFFDLTGGTSSTIFSDGSLHFNTSAGNVLIDDGSNLAITSGGNITLDSGSVTTTSGTIQGSIVEATSVLDLPALTTPPASPTAGSVYFDTTIPSGTATGSIQVYDGTAWHTVTNS